MSEAGFESHNPVSPHSPTSQGPPSPLSSLQLPSQGSSPSTMTHGVEFSSSPFNLQFGDSSTHPNLLLFSDAAFGSVQPRGLLDLKEEEKSDNNPFDSSATSVSPLPKGFSQTAAKNDKMISGFDGRLDGLSPLSIIAVTSYQESGQASPSISRTNPVLRYQPGGDAMFSAIDYSENDVLQEGGFDVPASVSFGSLDGLLGGSTASSIRLANNPSSTTFDLLDGDVAQESYMETGSDLQLSPQTFTGSTDNLVVTESTSISSGINDTTTAEELKNRELTAEKIQVLTKAAIASAVAAIPKPRPLKATSPSRPTTQPCPTCGKVFSNSSALTKHKLTHSDERKYVCQLCNKAFKRQDHLNGHMLTHRNKKPYECDVEGCEKSYCDARSLRRHKENHHASSNTSSTPALTLSAGQLTLIPSMTSVSLPPGFQASVIANSSGTVFSNQSSRIQYAPSSTSFTQEGLSGFTTASGQIMVSSGSQHLQFLTFQQQPSASQKTEEGKLPSWQKPGLNANTVLLAQKFGAVKSENMPSSTQLDDIKRDDQGGSQQVIAQQSSSSRTPPTSVPVVVKQESINTEPSSSEPLFTKGQVPISRHCSESDATMSPSSIVGSLPNTPTTTEAPVKFENHAPLLQQLLTPANSQQEQPKNTSVLPQWNQLSFSDSSGSNVVQKFTVQIPEESLVECSLCQRKFKNIPALNGHMRLHGGYFKKQDTDIKKIEKKADTPSSTNPPLQTASMNVRALIEEIVIQRRITRDPPPSAGFSFAPVTEASPQTPTQPTIQQQQPPQQPQQPQQQQHIQQQIQQQQQLQHQLQQHHHIQQQQQQFHQQLQQQSQPQSMEIEMQDSPHPQQQYTQSPSQPPVLSPKSQDSPVFTYFPTKPEDWQQEILNQRAQFRVPSTPAEKLRRHSDSDHFLSSKKQNSFAGTNTLADLLRQKVVAKRTCRSGSDPGELLFGEDSSFFSSLESSSGLDKCDFGSSLLQSLSKDSEQMSFFDSSLSKEPESVDFLSSELNDNGMTIPVELNQNNEASLQSQVEEIVPPVTSTTPKLSENSGQKASREIPQAQQQQQQQHPVDDAFEDDDVFLSPTTLPTSPLRARRKHRPEPLYIPPHVNACGFQSRLRSPRLWDPSNPEAKNFSPPPYTPPPMLSPVRSGSGLFWHILSGSGSITPKSAPITPSFGLVPRTASVGDSPAILEEEEQPAPETDILPHVNIGSQFQARLPVLNKSKALEAEHKADIVWDPSVMEKISEEELNLYLEFACCAAVPASGRNKEYALHLLKLCGGNIQDAILRLMEPHPTLPSGHPLLNYQYSETDKWTAEEIEVYQQALNQCDKDFFSISNKICSKSVKQCIQFYYLWKKVCPEEYKRLRMIRRRREQESIFYNLRSKDEQQEGSQENAIENVSEKTEGVLQDMPTSESAVPSLPNGPLYSGVDSPSSAVSQKNASLPQVTCNGSVAATEESFPCKICGKVFTKVKSRNAHMKTHRPPESDKTRRFEF